LIYVTLDRELLDFFKEKIDDDTFVREFKEYITDKYITEG
jgi:hypothetical protein